MNKSIKHTALAVLSLVAVFVLSACDTNTATPAELSQDLSITIVKFTASTGSSPVLKDAKIEFSWEIAVEEGAALDKIEILPDGGESKGTTGSITVTAKSTADFTLNAYAKAKGDALPNASRIIHIEVIDAAGNVILEPATAENCTDKKDNDYNGDVDCDDEACATDTTCDPNAKYKITYSLSPKSGKCVCPDGAAECSCKWSSTSEEAQPTYYQTEVDGSGYMLVDDKGAPKYEEVTVKWEAANCTQVTLSNEDGIYSEMPRDASGDSATYTFKPIKGSDTTLNLFGYDADGKFKVKSGVDVKIKKTEVASVPAYYAKVTPTVSASAIFYGQSVTYSVKVEKSNSATIEYTIGSKKYTQETLDDIKIERGDNIDDTHYTDEVDEIKFSISVVDDQGIAAPSAQAKAYERTVSVHSFKPCEKCTNIGEIKQVVPGYDGTSYYALTSGNKIYKITNNGEKAVPVSGGWDGSEISTIAVDTTGSVYAATTASAVYRDSSKISSCCSPQTAKAIYAKDNNTILIGTDEVLYVLSPKTGNSCGEGSHDEGTYCRTLGNFDGRQYEAGWMDPDEDYVEFYSFIPNLSTPSTVIASTELGAFVSTNSGVSFETDSKFSSIGDEILNGFVKNPTASNPSYIWDENSIYSYTGGSSVGIMGSSFSGYFGYVTKINDVGFVGTTGYVYYSFVNAPDTWLTSNLATGNQVMVIMGGEESSGAKVKVMGGGEGSGNGTDAAKKKETPKKVVRAILQNGDVYELTWGGEVPVSQMSGAIQGPEVDAAAAVSAKKAAGE